MLYRFLKAALKNRWWTYYILPQGGAKYGDIEWWSLKSTIVNYTGEVESFPNPHYLSWIF